MTNTVINLSYHSNPWSEWSAWSVPRSGYDQGFSGGNRGFSGGLGGSNRGFSGRFGDSNRGFSGGFGDSNRGYGDSSGRPVGLRQRQAGSGECCASNYVCLTCDVQEVPAGPSTPARVMEAAQPPGGAEGRPVEVGRRLIFQTTIRLLGRLSLLNPQAAASLLLLVANALESHKSARSATTSRTAEHLHHISLSFN